MTKICNWKDCGKEIQEWQSYCAEHYEMMLSDNQKDHRKEESENVQPVEQPKIEVPEMPEQELSTEQMQEKIREKMREKYREKERESLSVDERKKRMSQIKGEDEVKERPLFKNLADTDKIFIRQVAFSSAVDLMCHRDIENKTFDRLLGEIETLTNQFSEIIMTDYDM